MTTLKTLSKEEKELLMAEAKEELKKEEQLKKAERKKYKEIASEEVEALFVKMKTACTQMRDLKIEIYNSIQALIASKKEVFDVNGDQKTHTLSTLDGSKRIVVGYRDLIEWDGTEGAGVEKVMTYLSSLGKDEKSNILFKMVTTLLRPDRNGNLNPTKIIELAKMADEINEPEFTDGVNIIRQAQRVGKSRGLLDIEERVRENHWRNVELDFSDLIITETNV